MKKMLLLTLMILSTFAFASPGDDGCIGNCSGSTPVNVTNDFNQWQANIQAQKQAQAQKQQQQQVANADSNSESRSSSNSLATGGAGGAANSSAAGGSADNSVVVDASSDYNGPKASSAASVVVGNCQSGGSGQTQSGGLSTVFDSAQCQALRQVTAEQQLYVFYTEIGDTEQAAIHLENMAKYSAQAANAVDNSEVTKTVGGGFLDLIPVGVIAFLL